MSSGYYNQIVHNDCPNCGEGLAVMGNTKWEHSYSCCSDKCGIQLKDKLKNLKSSNKIQKRLKKIRELKDEIRGYEYETIIGDRKESCGEAYCLEYL